MILVPALRCLYLVERVDGLFDLAWSTVRLAGRCAPDAHGYRFKLQDLEGTVWMLRPSEDRQMRTVFTSNGVAYVLRTQLAPGVPHVAAICFGPKISLDADVSQGKQITITARAEGVTHRTAVNLDALQVAYG